MTAPSPRQSAQAGLHVRYEKAGLILDALPIPWNADAVIVEANVRLPKTAARVKQDFTLRWSEGPAVPAELLVKETKTSPLRVYFRTPPPAQTSRGSLFWKEHPLGEVEAPITTPAAYLAGFTIEMPTVHVALGEQTVACQSCVSAQAKGLFASAVLRSAGGPLAPALDLGLRVDVERSNGQRVASIAIALTSEQLRARQALVTILLPRLRWVDTYRVSWHLAARCVSSQTLRAVSKKTLQRSLRISATRFVLHRKDGTLQTVRTLPERDGRLLLDDILEIAPCFYVSSGEPGMAGLVPLTLCSFTGEALKTLATEKATLITNGPTPIVLGAVKVGDAVHLKHFALASGDVVLGNLTLLPAPAAQLTPEGGYAGTDEFLWSPAAQEQLDDRLGKLLDGV
jgi:hypothetical protein